MWDFSGKAGPRVESQLKEYSGRKADLAPAKWIWLPSERTLPNTVVLFRRTIDLPTEPTAALLELTAESRYRLWVNGRLIQFGPAPADPRWPDVDRIDIASVLRPGRNTIGVEVLYYGHGDGTWVMGKPGFLLKGQISAGKSLRIISDRTWECRVDRCRTPVRPKRWFLRALQEVYDARLEEADWHCLPAMEADPPSSDHRWIPAMELGCAPHQPALCSDYPDYLSESSPENPEGCFLRRRQIPSMDCEDVLEATLSYGNKVTWRGDPEDWFDYRIPDLFTLGAELDLSAGVTVVPASDAVGRSVKATVERGSDETEAAIVTFDLGRQVVGWPYVELEAPEGTIVEISLQEGHDPKKSRWLDTHLFRWLRYVCRNGVQRFEAFEYDSLRWLQLHIRNNRGPVTVRSVGVRRRRYRYAASLSVHTSDKGLSRLFEACGNTVDNAVHETLVDCMGRERQQYAGDVSYEMPRLLITAYDEYRHPRRFLRTYSEGVTPFGYFMDTWPAVDRTIRIPQRMLGLTRWGPILDHSVGFVFDCYSYYFYSGDLQSIAEVYPALCSFLEYLATSLPYTELFQVENLGIPSVWMDHDAYERQRHKQCAYNLYITAMLRYAFAPLADAVGDETSARGARLLSRRVHDAVVKRFFSDEHGVFVANLPWMIEEDEVRLCDRSLATSVLFDLCPGGKVHRSVDYLIEMPSVVGKSYVANQMWRHQALAKANRTDVLLLEYRTIWAKMRSVVDNGTVSEHWTVTPDSPSQYSHNGVVPLLILFSEIAGIKPTRPGFLEYEIRPQLANLSSLHLVYHTPYGPIDFTSKLEKGAHRVSIVTPEGATGVLKVAGDANAGASLLPDSFLEEPAADRSEISYTLPSGGNVEISIPTTLRR